MSSPEEPGQVLFLVEIIEAGDFNQQQARLASPYRVSSPFGQVLFLVEIIEAGGFNQQQARLASLCRVSSPSQVRA